MKIVIIGAMEQEIALLKAQMENCETRTVSYLNVFTGNINQHDIFLVQCGIGKVASAAATALLIQTFTPDRVINTGSAGGFDKELDIGDVVIATQLLHHDVDVTHFGYKLGQVPQMPEYYVSDETLVSVAKNAISDISGIKAKTGLVCTGDSFVGSDEAAALIRTNFSNMAAVEMEGAAIAQVCHLMKTPFVVIRSLSDIAGKTSTMSFEAYLEVAAKHSAQFVINMLNKL
jgi:adenosylhomocysteine nucleosidase